ncbi:MULTISPECIES: hypothetical protein [unclassified Microcoleus]|uniref:hypothetical protein n=1 Tax=unclassified Microcoleus TaxID=2642155 RepID=UPI002FD0F1EF
MVTLAIGKVGDSKCDRASKFWKIQVKLRDWGKIEAIAPFKNEERRSCNIMSGRLP